MVSRYGVYLPIALALLATTACVPQNRTNPLAALNRPNTRIPAAEAQEAAKHKARFARARKPQLALALFATQPRRIVQQIEHAVADARAGACPKTKLEDNARLVVTGDGCTGLSGVTYRGKLTVNTTELESDRLLDSVSLDNFTMEYEQVERSLHGVIAIQRRAGWEELLIRTAITIDDDWILVDGRLSSNPYHSRSWSVVAKGLGAFTADPDESGLWTDLPSTTVERDYMLHGQDDLTARFHEGCYDLETRYRVKQKQQSLLGPNRKYRYRKRKRGEVCWKRIAGLMPLPEKKLAARPSRRLFERNPNAGTEKAVTAERLNGEARQLYEQGDYAGARALFDQAYRIHPDARYRFNLCLVHEALDDVEAAEEHCTSVIRSQGANDRLRKKATTRLKSLRRPQARN